MYEKEIENLSRIKSWIGAPESDRAVNAAIALMRAAQPQDEAAEQEYCREAAIRAAGTTVSLRAVITDERAAARAEGYAAANRDLSTYRESCQDELLAAQTEIERLRNENKQLVDQEIGQSMDCARHERTIRREFEAELAAARGRIIALETGQGEFEDSSQDELQIKLTNLRTAAEEHLRNSPSGSGTLRLSAAIEESK